MQVLHADNHVLVCVKPAGLLMQADVTGDTNLLEIVRDHHRQAHAKPGNVYIGLVHRLDRPVSGVVVFALTSKSAARLSEQFREGQVRKRYLAVVERAAEPTDANAPAAGVWEDTLLKDGVSNTVKVLDPDEPCYKGKRATTAWSVLGAVRGLSLLLLEPTTGRGHQLRAQAAAHACPIFGDGKYGSNHSFDRAIALHAVSLTFQHPTKREPMTFSAPPPATWARFPWNWSAVVARLDNQLQPDA